MRNGCCSHESLLLGFSESYSNVTITAPLCRVASFVPTAGVRGVNLVAHNLLRNNDNCDKIVYDKGDVVIPTRSYAVSQFKKLDLDMSQLRNKGFKFISKPIAKFLRRAVLEKQVIPFEQPWDCASSDIDDTLNKCKSIHFSKHDYHIYRIFLCTLFEPFKRGENPHGSAIDEYLHSITRQDTSIETTMLKNIQRFNDSAYEEMSSNEETLVSLMLQLYNKYPNFASKLFESKDLTFDVLARDELTAVQKAEKQSQYELSVGQLPYSGQFYVLLNAFDLPCKEYGDKVWYRLSKNKCNITFEKNQGFVAKTDIVEGEELTIGKLPIKGPDNSEFKDFITPYAFYRTKFEMTEMKEKRSPDVDSIPTQLLTSQQEKNYEVQYLKPW